MLEVGSSLESAEAPAAAQSGVSAWWDERWRRWQRLTGRVGLGRAPIVAGWDVLWIAVAAAVVVGLVLSVQDWQAVRDDPAFKGVRDDPTFHRHLIVDAITAFVLTPLAVTIFLTLRGRTRGLLIRLRRDRVIRTRSGNKTLKEFAHCLDDRLNRKWPLAAVTTVSYVVLHAAAQALNARAGPLTTQLTLIALVVQAALLYVGVLAVAQVSATCRAIGGLPREFEVRVQPLHPDGCGGLWPIGSLLSLVLFAAAILGSTSLGIFLALEGTPSPLTWRPESVLLAIFYFILLPSAIVDLLWRPHQLMRRRRGEILTPVTEEFNEAISRRRSSAIDDSEQLKAKVDADAPSEIAKRFLVLDDACPTWPLRMRRLQAVTVTAVLPLAISVVTAVISRVLTGAP